MNKFKISLKSQLTRQAVLAVILGNIITGIGVSILRFSQMGNDPYTASNLSISYGIGIGLGNYQLLLNICLLVIQLIWGRKYLGLGTIVNMIFLGYIVQFTSYILYLLFPTITQASFIIKLLIMLLSLIILSFGLSMYQTANLGVSPYDYLSLGMTEHFKTPYFMNRMITDGVCLLSIIIALFVGFIDISHSNLGIGTILCTFCLGPIVHLFVPFHEKWIR